MLRKIPQSYSKEYRAILKHLVFSKTARVVGSGGEKEVLYSADVDVMDEIVLTHKAIKSIQSHVLELERMPFVRVTDIKCGVVDEWQLLTKPKLQQGKVVGYNRQEEVSHLKQLRRKDIISVQEYNRGVKLLKQVMTPTDFLLARKELRFGIVRWKPEQVKDGYRTLRDGRRYTLYEGCESSPFKVDAVVFFPKQVVEFSSIVLWKGEDGHYLNILPAYDQAIKEDILLYADKGNWFKVAKRMYLLSRLRGNEEDVVKFRALFNSPLGFLYVVVSDLELLKEVNTFGELSELERESVRGELDELRMAYAKLPTPKVIPKVADIPALRSLLQDEAKQELVRMGYYPIPEKFTA
jgi:hypothetical protein